MGGLTWGTVGGLWVTVGGLWGTVGGLWVTVGGLWDTAAALRVTVAELLEERVVVAGGSAELFVEVATVGVELVTVDAREGTVVELILEGARVAFVTMTGRTVGLAVDTVDLVVSTADAFVTERTVVVWLLVPLGTTGAIVGA